MSTDDPPKRKAPPDPRTRNTSDGPDPDRSIESSAARIMTAAQEALDVAMEHGANLGEASTWLALNLAKTTIQLNPNSNQLDPEKLEDMANKSLDIKGNRETSEAMEKVLRKNTYKYTQPWKM